MKKQRGRPSLYSADLAASICELLASGESLIGICRKKEMPVCSTVFKWLTMYPEFTEMYARAREMQADYYAAEIAEIADTCRIGQKIKTLPDGKQEVTTADMIERSRLQVDARKWLMAKLAPRKYGDRLELAGDPDNPLTVNLAAADVLREARLKRRSTSEPTS